MNDSQRLSATVPLDFAGKRLDQALATLFNDYSRARLQQWVRDGLVTVDGNCWQVNKDKLCGGEVIEGVAELPQETRWQPQAIELDVIYEDAHILIINKPPGLVVHPAAGNRDGTLLNALLHYAPELQHVPRAGIVHRLDKDTSGLMVVARSLTAQKHLVEQLQARRMAREYDAVVFGALVAGGSVDAPIGRHPVDRKRMAVVEQESKGKPAVSHYRVQERFKDFTHVSVRLETGRTHQIRVHMTHIRHSLVGDPVYRYLVQTVYPGLLQPGQLSAVRGAGNWVVGGIFHAHGAWRVDRQSVRPHRGWLWRADAETDARCAQPLQRPEADFRNSPCQWRQLL